MGREVRRVPKGWEHPKEGGHYRPMFAGDAYAEHAASAALEGEPPPDPAMYMPCWSPEEATQWMMYEDTTEGTPISPAFDTPEELARWLAETGASAFGFMTASYEAWLGTIRAGWVPSGVAMGGRLMSGVEAEGMED